MEGAESDGLGGQVADVFCGTGGAAGFGGEGGEGLRVVWCCCGGFGGSRDLVRLRIWLNTSRYFCFCGGACGGDVLDP